MDGNSMKYVRSEMMTARKKFARRRGAYRIKWKVEEEESGERIVPVFCKNEGIEC